MLFAKDMKRSTPSEYNHCSLAPLEDLDDLDNHLDDDNNKDPSDAKRQKRMQRNRESAAISRERKRVYTEQLEIKLAQLAQIVATLRAENDALCSGRPPSMGSAPVPVPAVLALAPTTALVPAPAELEESLLLTPCLHSSDNDSESNDGPDTLELYSPLEVFKIYTLGSRQAVSRYPPSGRCSTGM